MKKGGIDIGYQAFDLTAKFVLGHYAENAKEEAKFAEDGFNRAQESLRTETDVARQASHEAEIAAFRQERADAEQARELLESTKDGAAQGSAVRDLRGYIKDQPLKESENGSIVPTLEGVKQLIKIGPRAGERPENARKVGCHHAEKRSNGTLCRPHRGHWRRRDRHRIRPYRRVPGLLSTSASRPELRIVLPRRRSSPEKNPDHRRPAQMFPVKS